MSIPPESSRPEPSRPGPTDDSAWFGDRPVSADEKPELVRGVFESVAGRYDLMNDLMSGGLHRLWKNRFVEKIAPRPGERFVDVAGGTGDIAFRLAARLGPELGAAGSIAIVDLTPAMLAVGHDRAIDRGLLQGLEWIAGDAEALPLPDMSMDAYSIAFGLRNVTHIDRALAEARRVLKPGGRFFCLEFSRFNLPGLEKLYDLYSFQMLPALGRLVARDADSYRYLAESIRRFPPQDELCRLIEAAGLARARYENLSGGIAAIHSAWRL